MRKEGLISVIVPIYKVEKYLEACVESIIKQTYTKLEIILIDDDSPDGCGAICDRYAKEDHRIIVIHQENRGAAAARNTGLRVSTGEYIAFVDADDYLEPDAYEKMITTLQENDADIVQGGFRYIYVNHQSNHQENQEILYFSASEYLIHFTEEWTCALCWDKLFRSKVLSNVFFEEGHLIDDEFFTYQVVMNAKKIIAIPDIIYNYRQRASSVMKNRAVVERKNLDTIEAMEKRRDGVSVRFPELKSHYENQYVDYLLWFSGSEQATRNTIVQIKKRLCNVLACGRVLFWKQGQRKRFVEIVSFLMRPAGKILSNRRKGLGGSIYEFFE